MKSKGTGKRLFLLALIFAVITAGLSYVYLGEQKVKNKAPEVETIKVWVAKVNIPAREVVTEDMIVEVSLPKHDRLDGYIGSIEDIVGKFTSESILVGEGFPPERLMDSIDDELSLRIHGSMRAVSILVDKNAGVSDFIRPGDKIDVFMYLPELGGDEEIIRPELTKLMLQNIEVLAVRKNSNREFPEDEEVSGAYDMTLAIPVLEIEKLYLAQKVGFLKLALRPFSGDTFYNSYGTIWEELLLDKEMKHRNFFPEYSIQENLALVTEDKLGEYEELVEETESNTNEVTELKDGEYTLYTVVYGDTLIKISKRFYDNVYRYTDLKRANGLRTNKIYPGQTLKIPKFD